MWVYSAYVTDVSADLSVEKGIPGSLLFMNVYNALLCDLGWISLYYYSVMDLGIYQDTRVKMGGKTKGKSFELALQWVCGLACHCCGAGPVRQVEVYVCVCTSVHIHAFAH